MTLTMQPTLTAKYGLPPDVFFCKRCVISNQRPSSVPEHGHTAESIKPTIRFDTEGICDACRFAERKQTIDWKDRHEELEELCARFRKNGAYDCLVPGSGGKDSFLAALTMKKMGMRPLLMTWAPHLYTDWGRVNLEAWQALGDHMLITPNRRVHRLLTRIAVEHLFHPFQPFVIGQKAVAAKIARRMRIQLIMFGENEAEYGNASEDANKPQRSAEYHQYRAGDMHLGGVHVYDLQDKHGLTWGDLEPYTPLANADELHVHYLGYYMKWHPQGAFYAATENGFIPSPERTPGTYSKYNSIDDKIDDFHYWTTYQKFGIGRATYDAAQEIRSGDIDRDEGVRLVRRFDGEWPARFAPEINDYLSVPGFEPMTDDRWWDLAHKFRSPHLWDGERLRYVVT